MGRKPNAVTAHCQKEGVTDKSVVDNKESVHI